MPRNVSAIFFDLQRLYTEFCEVAADGRIKMAEDSDNKFHTDPAAAVTAAAESFQATIDATRWMMTVPPYPVDEGNGED